MSGLRKLGSSILLGATSLLIILGGLSTTLAEDRINNPKISPTETSTPTFFLVDVESETPSTPGLIPTVTPIFTSTPTATIPASTNCPAPSGWISYIVQVGETLESLAIRYGTTADALKQANCLIGTTLLADTRIYIPSAPTSTFTFTPIPCGKPFGWGSYTVKTGDTLYKISRAYRVSVIALQNANCLGYSTNIKVGQKLYVPNVATSTPVITQTFTPTPTSTATPSTPMPTYTSTSTAIATASETATATQTLEPPTETPTGTATQVPSSTFTFTPNP